MAGYYKHPRLHNEFLPAVGMTGDLGFFDEEGYLFIRGVQRTLSSAVERTYIPTDRTRDPKFLRYPEVVVYKGKANGGKVIRYDFKITTPL
jgi:acyl-CoA synthetase (AMP-forming)/AMP-acid ligase II